MSATDADWTRHPGNTAKFAEAKAEDLAGVARLDWSPTTGVTVGGSIYYGGSGQDIGVDATTEMYQAHLDVQRQGLSFRALVVQAQVDDVAELIVDHPGR